MVYMEMTMKHLIPILLACLFSPLALSTNIEPRDLIRQAMDHWRGTSSYSEMTMTIHRPDWQRSMSMRSWTRGDKTSLVGGRYDRRYNLLAE